MKLSQAGLLRKQFTENGVVAGGRSLTDLLRQNGFEVGNLYQELEMDSRFVNTHEDVSQNGEVVQLHSHTFYELLYCRSGSLQYLLGSERYRIQRGDILFIPPGVSHRPLFLEDLAEPYARYVVWMSQEFIDKMQQISPELDLGSLQPHMLRPQRDSWTFWETLFRQGCVENAQRAPGWNTAVLGNTAQLLVHLSRAFSEKGHEQPPAVTPELLDTVMAYVEAHLAEKITLEGIARRFLVSESTIGQVFRNKLGVSFYRCVTQRRLIAAKGRILAGEPLEQVSTAVGFSDYSTFYRAFKREYGISPVQFRKLRP